MAFTVQDDTGLVVGANAYISVAFFDSYFTDRNNTAAVALATALKQASIIAATAYIDDRFVFRGAPLNSVAAGQNTAFPRSYLCDARDDPVVGLPLRLKQACAEYALRQSASPLLPDPVVDSNGKVTYTRSRVEGAVEEEIHYADDVFLSLLKPYPVADRLLQQYRFVGGLLRA